MTWFRVAFDDALTHCVHRDLRSPLVGEMMGRDSPVTDFVARYGRDPARELGGNPAAITEWCFDLGGATYQNLPRETIIVDGLSVEIDCDHFDMVLDAVDKSTLRRFSTGDFYHKLKFWHHATVLTREQHRQVRDAMAALVGSARRRSAEFYAEREAARKAAKESA